MRGCHQHLVFHSPLRRTADHHAVTRVNLPDKRARSAEPLDLRKWPKLSLTALFVNKCRRTPMSYSSRDIIIRPLVSYDIPKVRALHSSLLPINYPTSFFLQFTLLPGRVCLVAYHPANPENPVAFISAVVEQNPRIHGHSKAYLINNGGSKSDVKLSENTPHIEILTLGVLPAFQQRGVARLLLRQVYRYFRANPTPELCLSRDTMIHANVATSNMPALSFYERMGLRIASGVIRNLYRTVPHGSKDGYFVVGRLSAE